MIKIQEMRVGAGRGQAETVENEVDMREEGVTGDKISECGERLGKGKLQRREGIKRSLRDITPVSYEEYDNSCRDGQAGRDQK